MDDQHAVQNTLVTNASHVSEWKEIILSGAGTGGLAILGALQWLHEHEYLTKITRWVGTSSGAIIAILVLSGYEPVIIYRILSQLPFKELANDFNADSVLGLFDTMGLMEPTLVLRLYTIMLHKKGFSDTVTIQEFKARTGADIVITGYCMSTADTVTFDAESHPNMPLITACRITMSVPLLFRPVVFEGKMYVAGGTIEHIPVRFAKFKRRSLVIHCYKEHPPSWPVATNLLQLTNQMKSVVGRQLENLCIADILRKRPHTVLKVTFPFVKDAYVVDFSLDTEAKRHMYENGRKSAIEWDRSLPSQKTNQRSDANTSVATRC